MKQITPHVSLVFLDITCWLRFRTATITTAGLVVGSWYALIVAVFPRARDTKRISPEASTFQSATPQRCTATTPMPNQSAQYEHSSPNSLKRLTVSLLADHQIIIRHITSEVS